MNKLLSLLLLCTSCWLACKTDREPCLQSKNVRVKMELKRRYADTGTTFVDTSFRNALLNPLNGLASYTLGDTTVSGQAFVRLSPVADSCAWVFRPSAGIAKADTIWFYYSRENHFIDNACGFTEYFTINQVRANYRTLGDTLHSIDSITLLKAEVTNNANESHLRIYFHR